MRLGVNETTYTLADLEARAREVLRTRYIFFSLPGRKTAKQIEDDVVWNMVENLYGPGIRAGIPVEQMVNWPRVAEIVEATAPPGSYQLIPEIPGPKNEFAMQTETAAVDKIKANPEVIGSKQAGTVTVSSEGLNIPSIVSAFFGTGANVYEKVQAQRLADTLRKYQLRRQPVNLPPGSVNGSAGAGGLPWGWIIFGGAVLVGLGIFATRKRSAGLKLTDSDLSKRFDTPKL